MTPEAFSIGLRTLSTATPYMRTLTEDEVKCLWMLLDQSVKEAVPDRAWFWAIKIRMSERSQDQELPIHYQVLRHVFRCENGQPNFRWGLKADLVQRIELCSTHAEVERYQVAAASQPVLDQTSDALQLRGEL
jgi:hypothetical protein